MRLSHEDRQGVVELVRDTGEQGSHRGELLAPQKLLGSLQDRLLERSVVALELEIEPPSVEQVLDPQEDFEPVKRLGQEVFRAGGQGALLGLERHVRGQHRSEERRVGKEGRSRWSQYQ